MCDGKPQGTYAQKLGDCGKCDFFALVKKEEGKDFLMTISLIKKVEE